MSSGKRQKKPEGQVEETGVLAEQVVRRGGGVCVQEGEMAGRPRLKAVEFAGIYSV